MHNITDTNKSDKMGETARTVSRIGQKPAHTAMDYALGAQAVNTEILRRTSQAWIEGFRYQVRLSQGMAQVFWGQWGAAFKSVPPVERPGQEQSGFVGIEPATNGAQKVTEPAAKDAQKDIEIAEKAEKVARETRKAEKVARKKKKATEDAQKAEKKAETRQAEKVAGETRQAEEADEETQEKTEIAAKSAQRSAEPAAEETQKSTERAAKDAQKNTETAAFPIDGYDEMNVGEVSERLNGLSEAELKRVGEYEKDNKDRVTLRKEMEQKTETTS